MCSVAAFTGTYVCTRYEYVLIQYFHTTRSSFLDHVPVHSGIMLRTLERYIYYFKLSLTAVCTCFVCGRFAVAAVVVVLLLYGFFTTIAISFCHIVKSYQVLCRTIYRSNIIPGAVSCCVAMIARSLILCQFFLPAPQKKTTIYSPQTVLSKIVCFITCSSGLPDALAPPLSFAPLPTGWYSSRVP